MCTGDGQRARAVAQAPCARCTGRARWLPGGCHWRQAAVAVDERRGRVLVANESLPDLDSPWDNSLVLLNTRTGDVLGNLPLDAPPVAVAVDARTERVFLVRAGPRRSGPATDPGRVSVLDARTGTVRRTITLGWSPRAIALDTRAGRAFVLTSGSNAMAILDGIG